MPFIRARHCEDNASGRCSGGFFSSVQVFYNVLVLLFRCVGGRGSSGPLKTSNDDASDFNGRLSKQCSTLSNCQRSQDSRTGFYSSFRSKWNNHWQSLSEKRSLMIMTQCNWRLECGSVLIYSSRPRWAVHSESWASERIGLLRKRLLRGLRSFSISSISLAPFHKCYIRHPAGAPGARRTS